MAPSTMIFRNFGGIHQFTVSDDGDLAGIDHLDPARWAATSAPLSDLHCDAAFLAVLDPAGTGRIRVSQLVEARDWLFDRLARRGALRAKSDVLQLADIDVTREAGVKLRAAAEDVIHQRKLDGAKSLSLSEVRAFRAGYQATLANGDGVVPAGVVTDAEVAQAITDIVATTGGARDAGGSDGVGQAELDKFIAGATAWLAWRERGPAAMVWSETTESAAAAVTALDAKLEEYFLQCDLLNQEDRAASDVLLKDEDLRAIFTRDAASLEKYLADAPFSTAMASGGLPLDARINPAYRERFETLKSAVLTRALGATATLDRGAWRSVKATFDGFAAWQKDKPREDYDALGEARVRAILSGPLPAKIVELIAVDKAAAPHIEQVADVEKMILLQRWLVELANNFVNFSAIYRPTDTALVEMGSLVIDGRRLDFCLKVADHGGHKKIASESLIYLVYASITEKDGSTPIYEIVAPVTGGERGRLRIGKRGIFIDLAGKEWDAQVSDIVENPISVIEAMFAPFRRVQLFVGKKIEDWVGSAQASQEKAMLSSAEAGVGSAHAAAEQAAKDAAAGKAPPAAAPAKPEGKGLDANSVILGGGIALAGVSSVLAAVFGLFTTLKGWLAVLAIVAAVLALSALVGWLRLRRRDMGLMLEASGWAINISMKLNRRIGRVFTFTPALPPGSVIDRFDALRRPEDKGWGGRIAFGCFLLAVFALGYWFVATGHRLPFAGR